MHSQLRKWWAGLDSKGCKVADTRDFSRIIKQSETGSTSRLSYVQQCKQPGNQAKGTVALCVASEI